jgi:hypothetical protein
MSSTLYAVAMLLLGVPLFLFFTLLPSFFELKKPKDAGPRLILADSTKILPLLNVGNVPLIDIEEPCPKRINFCIRGAIIDLEA